GIRDGHVTGVQTCALPISRATRRQAQRQRERGRKGQEANGPQGPPGGRAEGWPGGFHLQGSREGGTLPLQGLSETAGGCRQAGEIGRASCTESVGSAGVGA